MPAFLASMAQNGNVTQAAAAAGVDRAYVYAYRNRHPDFAAAWESAYQSAVDGLEREAWRRATDGTDEPVFYQGDVCGHVRKYSDQLLIELLRGHRPKRYRQRVEITVREEAEKIAKRLGLDAQELIAEAERIARGEVPA